MSSKNFIEYDCSDGGVLVWESPINQINKKTLITVPLGLRVIVCKNGERIGSAITACENRLLKEVFPLDKSDLKGKSKYEFCYVTSDSSLLSFKWGVGNVAALDTDVEMPYKWGGHGNYIISVENPMRLKKAIEGNINPIKKADLDGAGVDVVFGAVKMIVVDTISKLIANEKVSALNLNSRLISSSDKIAEIMRTDTSLMMKLGLKIVNFTIASIGLNDEQLEIITENYRAKKEGAY